MINIFVFLCAWTGRVLGIVNVTGDGQRSSRKWLAAITSAVQCNSVKGGQIARRITPIDGSAPTEGGSHADAPVGANITYRIRGGRDFGLRSTRECLILTNSWLSCCVADWEDWLMKISRSYEAASNTHRA